MRFNDYQKGVMHAWVEGAEIEYSRAKWDFDNWYSTSTPTWNWDIRNYRIKRKLDFSKLRPGTLLTNKNKETIVFLKYFKKDSKKSVEVILCYNVNSNIQSISMRSDIDELELLEN